jgi:hypothetical protein
MFCTPLNQCGIKLDLLAKHGIYREARVPLNLGSKRPHSWELRIRPSLK